MSIEALDSGTSLVRVSGEIDFAVAGQFEEKLHEFREQVAAVTA